VIDDVPQSLLGNTEETKIHILREISGNVATHKVDLQSVLLGKLGAEPSYRGRRTEDVQPGRMKAMGNATDVRREVPDDFG
jgi:hypothetical protein